MATTAERITQIRTRRAAINDRLKAIEAEAGDSPLSAEQREEWDKLTHDADPEANDPGGEDEQLAAELAELEADQRRLAARKQKEGQRISQGRVTREGQPGNPSGPTEPIGNPRQSSEDDPMKGFKSPREFLGAVMDVATRGRLDDRLKPLAAAGSDEHSGADNTYSGFFVPEAMSPEFLKIDPEDDPMLGRTRRVPMESKSVKFNYRVDKDHSSSVSGGLMVTRRAETVEGTLKRMATRQFELTAYSLFGFAAATEEILVDSPQSFAALIAAGFSEEFTSHIINERLNGSGVGEYLGILASGALITVDKETGQAAATITYENVVNMVARCWGYDNAVWLANHTVLPQLSQLSAPAGTGGNAMIWQPSAREGSPSMLMGRPVIFTEYAKALGTAGDLILVNGTQYLEGVYQPLQSAESVHVRFLNHERIFKFWLRNAGSPWWDAPLTPKNGDTLSPFVVLQSR